MDLDRAKEVLTNLTAHALLERCDAARVAVDHYGSAAAAAKEMSASVDAIRKWSLLSQLPRGILWLIDTGQIRESHGEQLARLSDEQQQFVLASAIIEGKLKAEECRTAVNTSKDSGKVLNDVLSEMFGITFSDPHPIMLSFEGNDFIRLNEAAWTRGKRPADLCKAIVVQWLLNEEFASRMNVRQLGDELETVGRQLKKMSLLDPWP